MKSYIYTQGGLDMLKLILLYIFFLLMSCGHEKTEKREMPADPIFIVPYRGEISTEIIGESLPRKYWVEVLACDSVLECDATETCLYKQKIPEKIGICVPLK
jgi:hypothetical protein